MGAFRQFAGLVVLGTGVCSTRVIHARCAASLGVSARGGKAQRDSLAVYASAYNVIIPTADPPSARPPEDL